MTKIKMTLMAFATTAAVMFNTGCSHTKQIGRIGNLEIYKIAVRGLDSPNITALATRNVQDNEVRFVETATGAGIGPALVGAAGGAGSAALNGVSLRPSNTRIQNTTTGNGGNGNALNSATGGNGGAGGSGQGYGSAGATSSSSSQSGSVANSDSWSGVIGSGNVKVVTPPAPGNNGNGGNSHNY